MEHSAKESHLKPFTRTAAALVLLMLTPGCVSHSNSPATAAPVAAAHPPFDADRAFGFLKAQCDFGPRPPHSAAHEKCKDYIIQQLTPYVDKVDTQIFPYRDSTRGVRLSLTNIIGVINPDAKRKIMLFTHWDTRPTADQEIDNANREKPIVGADDGASGTAVLLELARQFHDKKPDIGVVLLFVDGEDWGPGDEKMYLGAKYFAAHPGDNKPEYALLLDMIGDDHLEVHREKTSQRLHPEINDKVWNAAVALGYSAQFPDDAKYEITDDHDSFNAA
ncbi:MAG: glutamine cyclotransferase, partial [Capsulimonas sp.]|nr:glutamine cyclotransferase [Capsulimonas sp.]